MYEVKEPFWQFVDHWQTLVAGLLALVAAGGTVLGTLVVAKPQVKAANEAADRQIKAAAAVADRQVATAQEQTQAIAAAADRQVAAAQEQTLAARIDERRRRANERFSFHAVLVAAMQAVIEDVKAARDLPEGGPGLSHPAEAYATRQRVKRAGFAELRNGFLRFGETLTTSLFLQLDKEIEDFAGQWEPSPSGIGTYGHVIPSPPVGRKAGLSEQLDRIERQASTLRYEAEMRMKISTAELYTIDEILERLRAP